MVTILNKNTLAKAAIIIGVIALFISLAVFFGEKLKKGEKREIAVDRIEDIRGLGYSGQRKILADKKGNFYVAYRKKYNGYSEIFVARVFRENGKLKSEGTAVPISTVGSETDQRVPSIAIDSEDTLHVVWYGSDSKKQENNRQIKYSQSLDHGKSWSQWKNISPVDGFKKKDDFWQEHPMILAGSDSMLYAAWEGKDKENKEQQIKFSRSANGGVTWSQWKNIRPTPDNTQSRPMLVEDSAGNLFLFMYSSSGNDNDVQQVRYAMSSDRGDAWSEWANISDSKVDSRHISVAKDANGTIHAVWRSAIPSKGGSQIIYRAFQNGLWSESKVVNPSSGKFQFFPGVGVSEDIVPYVAWMESDSASDFPREDPESGETHVAFLQGEKFTALALPGDSAGLYPHIPEHLPWRSRLPLIYLRPEDSADAKNFILVFKSL